MKTIAEREKQLRDHLVLIDAKMHKIEKTLEQPEDQDVEERSVEREGDEPLEGIGNADLFEAEMINAALERIAAGTYGRCTLCDEPISEARLDVLPWTPFCEKCAHDQDKGKSHAV